MAQIKDTTTEEKNLKYFVKGLQTLWTMFEHRQKIFKTISLLVLFISGINLISPILWKYIFDIMQVVSQQHYLPVKFYWLIGILVTIGFVRNYIHSNKFQKKFLYQLIDIETNLPLRAHKKLLSLPMSYHTRENTGKKAAKVQDGCRKSNEIIMDMIWGILPNGLYILVSIIALIVISPVLGIIFGGLLAIVFHTLLRIARDNADAWEQYQKLKESAEGIMAETCMNMGTVKSYCREEWELERHRKIRKKMFDLDIVASFKIEKDFLGLSNILFVTYIVTGVLGVQFILWGYATWGTVVFVTMIAGQAMNNTWQIVHNYRNVMRNMAGVDRLSELLNVTESIDKGTANMIPGQPIQVIEFKDVDFRYSEDSAYVLKDFSLKLPMNKMIAFVGHSGNGKSTLMNLVRRFYDVSGGQIFVDGIDIRDIDVSWLRKQFAVVEQKVGIFEGTIAFNVAYGYPDASQESIEQALRAAQLHDVLSNAKRFKDGINTEVGERGIQLSGGEAQRVGIARAYLALLHGAKYLVLDEATASLDRPTESLFQKAVETIRREMDITILAIAHRIRTIQDADVINVVAHGKVIEKGTHSTLLKQHGVYAELVADDKREELLPLS